MGTSQREVGVVVVAGVLAAVLVVVVFDGGPAELVFMVDPAFKEQREKQTRAMEEKLAGGRRGENKWLLLDRLKNESWATQGLVSEEYRLFLVLLEWCDDG